MTGQRFSGPERDSNDRESISAGGAPVLQFSRRCPSARSGVAIVARACDAKQSDLPVTISSGACIDRRIEVLDSAGERLYWASDAEARELLRSKRARSISTRRGRLRALEIISDDDLIGAGSGPRRRPLVHRRETQDNPAGCWTLTRLSKSDRDLYDPAYSLPVAA